jgi:hypothetical protein
LVFDFGAMRLMAGIAGQTAGMIGAGHLGERVGLGGVSLVATGANHGGVGQRRLYGSGILGVPGLRAVTSLTVKADMPAQLLLIDYIGMTAFADFVTGMGNRTGRDFGDGVTAVMPVLSERFRDDSGAQDDEGDDRDQHDGGKPKKVFDVFEQNLTFGVRKARPWSERYEERMVFDTGNPGGGR